MGLNEAQQKVMNEKLEPCRFGCSLSSVHAAGAALLAHEQAGMSEVVDRVERNIASMVEVKGTRVYRGNCLIAAFYGTFGSDPYARAEEYANKIRAELSTQPEPPRSEGDESETFGEWNGWLEGNTTWDELPPEEKSRWIGMLAVARRGYYSAEEILKLCGEFYKPNQESSRDLTLFEQAVRERLTAQQGKEAENGQ